MQVKLLRAIQEKRVRKVGCVTEEAVDVRIICATHRNLRECVDKGSFRQDLYYRLNVIELRMPPLRERVDDIALLAEQFLADICQREGRIKHFSAEALAHFASYRWPGNVRELRNVVQRAYLMAADDTITAEWLPSDTPVALGPCGPAPSDNNDSITLRLGTTLAEAEYQLILATLRHFNNHKERTAAALGVSLKTLYNRLKEYAGNKAGCAGAAVDETLAAPLFDSCLTGTEDVSPLRQPGRLENIETAWTPGKSTTPNIG